MPSSGADRESQMLAEGAALRRLARSLVRADADAEDLVQDTMAASLASGNDDARKRPWLMGTLRNLALLWRRSSTRRATREHAVAAATPPHGGDPAAIAAQAETMRDVAAAVHELEEPFRTVIVLRFWRGLMPEAIAAELAVPRNTVRSRLQRGLEKLRTRLDRSHGDRGSWLAALVPFTAAAPFATVAAAPVGAAVTTWSASGALLMTKLHLAFAAVTLAVVGFLVWWFGQGFAAPLPAPAPAPGRSEVAQATGDAARPENGTASPGPAEPRDVRIAADVVTGLTIRGTVTGNGSPIAGLPLAVQWFDGTEAVGTPAAQQHVATDAAGSFVWNAPRPTVAGVVRAVRAEKAGNAKISCTPQLVLPGQTEVVLKVTALTLDRTVFGRVHDATGAPIAGAELSVNGWEDVSTRSDADGRYELKVTGPPYPLLVMKNGFRERLLDTYIPEGKDRHELDIELEPGAVFIGQVVDAAGNPVAAARIVASALARGTVTDAAGRFELGGAERDAHQELTATKPGFQRTSVVASAGGQPTRIVLRPGHSLAVRIVDDRGKGVTGARIAVMLESYRGLENRGFTDAEGRLRLVDMPSKVVELLAGKEGFVRARGEVDVPKTVGEFVLVMRPGRAIAGRVLDAAGAPIAGASVYCEIPSKRFPERSVGSRSTTDVDGRFQIQELPPEPCTVAVHHAEFLRATLDGIGGSPTDLVVRMQSAGSVAGRVVDAVTGAPVGAFTIELLDDKDAQPLHYVKPARFVDGDGYWRIKHWQLKPGAPLSVEVWAEGYAPQRVRTVSEVDAPRDQNVIRLFAGTTVRGIVRDAATGTPVPKVEVTLQSGDAKDSHLPPFSEVADRPIKTRVWTDAEGHFELLSVPPGENRLLLGHEAYPRRIFGPFQVVSGMPTLEVEPTLTQGATLRGRVTGLPDAAGRKITAHGFEDKTIEAVLGADGAFELRGVAAGRALLSLQVGNGGWHSMRLEVGDQDIADIAFVVPAAGSGAVRATVVGLPRGRGSIETLGVAPGRCKTTRTFEYTDAGFVVDALPPGKYEIEVYDSGFQITGKAEVTVGDREVAVTIDVVKR